MQKNNVARLLAGVLSLIVIYGCSNDEDEAKKLGFSNAAEMKEIHSKGWHTKERYDEDMAIAAGYSSYSEMKKALEKKRLAEEEKVRQEALAAERRKNLAVKCTYDVPSIINSFAFSGGRIMPPLMIIGTTISATKMLERYELEEEKQNLERKQVLMAGSHDFEGRVLPACVEKLNLNYINRAEGKRKTGCFQIAYVADAEFKMVRNISTFACEDSDSELKKWVEEYKISDLK